MCALAEDDAYARIADLYDSVVPYRTRSDVGFFVDEAKKHGGPVLELGCGTGRVLIPVARAGIDITGIDVSPGMLDVCRGRLQEEPEDVQMRVRLVRADMRSFDLPDRFRLATCPFRPFQHLLTVEDQIAALGAVRRHLAVGGRLILDVFNPSLAALVNDPLDREFGEEPEFEMPDGRRVVRRHKVVEKDLAHQVMHVDLVYYIAHPDGRMETEVQSAALRYFFRYELEHLLVRCGFTVVEIFGDYDRTPYGSTYPDELIFIAERAEEERT